MSIGTSPPGLVLRDAAARDCPLILELIRELAAYEKLEHEVTATARILEESLFGKTPGARAVIAELEGEPVGYALFFRNFSTFTGRPGIYLEDIYVRPAARGRGCGGRMLAYIARLAVDLGCARVEWSVLDWNEPSIRFYRSIGAAPMDGWTVQRLDGEALERLARTFE